MRLGQVEQLKESGRGRWGCRVFLGKRVANTSSSDFSAEALKRLVTGAMELARITSEDPFVGLPEGEEFGTVAGELGLYFEM